jgi:hypothetical protein
VLTCGSTSSYSTTFTQSGYLTSAAGLANFNPQEGHIICKDSPGPHLRACIYVCIYIYIHTHTYIQYGGTYWVPDCTYCLTHTQVRPMRSHPPKVHGKAVPVDAKNAYRESRGTALPIFNLSIRWT